MRRKLDELRALNDENKQLRAKLARTRASELAGGAVDGAVIRRVDGLAPNELRELAIAVRNAPDVDIVVLAGETPTGGVALAAAVTPGSPFEAAALIRDAAKAVGGGGGGKGDVATAGGKDPAGIEEALELAREAVLLARGDRAPGRHRQLVRVLALDLGSKRIGVAVSDLTGTVASPLTVLERSKSRRHDHERIAALVRDEEAELVVVGLPISLSGDEGPAARAARTEAKALATLVDVPIETFDERLTTVTAERALAEAGVRGRARRQVVDKVAAAVILQAFLDRRSRGPARVNTRHGGRPDIDDIDDVDVLETYDWNEDPWDASLGVSEVEPVRTRRGPRSGSATAPSPSPTC